MKSRTGILTLLIAVTPLTSFAHKGRHKKQEDPPSIAQKIKKSFDEINEGYLKDIKPIFVKKCFDCHSSQTVFPWYYKIPGVQQWIQDDIEEAKEHLDMDSNFPFKSHATPIEDLEEIDETIRNGEMPPYAYRLIHSGSALSPEEREAVHRWVEHGKELLKEQK